MRDNLYASIDELIAPETLSRVLGRRITTTRHADLAAVSAYSGSAVTAIETLADDEPGPRVVLKRIHYDDDYFMRATNDVQAREVRVWEHGLLQRLPPAIGHAIIAAARDGDNGWAILMRDIGPAMVLQRGVITPAEHAAILDGLAAMHATFWEDDAVQAGEHGHGLARPRDHYHIISPAVATREANTANPGLMPLMVHRGWENLASLLPPDLFDTLLALTNDPTPLCAALGHYPLTLVHGDARLANIAIEPRDDGAPRLTLIDWAIAGANAALLDLIWYLGARTPWLPEDRELAMDHYRARLRHHLGTRYDGRWWLPMLDLSILGGLIRFGWFTASEAVQGQSEPSRANAKADLLWWAERARRGIERL